MEKVNIKQKFSLFNDYWSPKLIGEFNETYVKAVKLKGEFIWHQHENEDELFLVIRGSLLMKFRDRDVRVEEGEFIIVRHGVEHLPIAEEEAQILLIEPKATLNTGNIKNERTVEELRHI
jgi:mannose-6-phosphate isomerase-like protein (cupin superfamily)